MTMPETKASSWMATRILNSEEANETKIIVYMGFPEAISLQEWRCAYQVTSETNDTSLKYAHGIDAFQALMLALEGLRLIIDKRSPSLTWHREEDDHSAPGDHGFLRFIPQYSFGVDFVRRLEKLVDSEIQIEISHFSNNHPRSEIMPRAGQDSRGTMN